MPQWLAKVVDALSGGELSEVRRILEAARRNRTKLHLESFGPGADQDDESIVLISTIEQVRAKDFVIDQPTIGGITRPLAIGEQLRVSFLTTSGLMTAETRSLGRVKIPSGGTRAFFGYHLAMPDHIEAEERRIAGRVLVGFDLAPEVELHTDRTHFLAPVRGVMHDLSAAGMKIRTRNAADRISPEDRVYLRVDLPDPVGPLTEMVVIVRVDPGRSSGENIIGVRFERHIETLDELIEELALRRKRRNRAD